MIRPCLAIALCLLGCQDQGGLYRPCDLDPNSPNEAVAACGGDSASDATCIVARQLQCDEGLCGRLDGADPICTQTCERDQDCFWDGDVCAPWGELGMHCMPAEWAESTPPA